MPKPAPRWVQNTLSFIFPIAGAFFVAERKEKERYNATKMIMVGDIKADWVRIGKQGNPFATSDLSVNGFMEQALSGRAAYWVDRFKNAKTNGETRVSARNLAVIDELTRNFTPVEPIRTIQDIKQTADLVPTIDGTSTAGYTNAGMFVLPSGSSTGTPQTPSTPGTLEPSKPWYTNMKIMIPVYLGAVALFYFMSKKR